MMGSRERLRGKWGVVDVHDAVEAIQQLGARCLIDPKRTAIRGCSAGQLTLDYFCIQLLLIFFPLYRWIYCPVNTRNEA
jgi:Prolyl oligopeptidase family